jgi:hypothetical protein
VQLLARVSENRLKGERQALTFLVTLPLVCIPVPMVCAEIVTAQGPVDVDTSRCPFTSFALDVSDQMARYKENVPCSKNKPQELS